MLNLGVFFFDKKMKFLVSALLSVVLLLCSAQLVEAQTLCDSIIKVNPKGTKTARSYFRYDANGYQVLAMHYTFNKKTSTWSGTYRESVSYDNNGNIVMRKMAYWDFDSNNWLTMVAEDMTYDSKSRRIARDYRKWNKERSVWLGLTKEKLQFNNMGLISEREVFDWDDASSEWNYDRITNYEYDDRGRVTYEETKRWLGTWTNEERTAYVYDADNYEAQSETSEMWNGTEWVPTKRSIYQRRTTNDENGYLYTLAVNYLTYNPESRTWTRTSRHTTQYDAHQTEVRNVNEEWTERGWNITKDERYDVQYNEDGYVTRCIRSRWNGGNEWIGISRTEARYNDYGDQLIDIKMNWDQLNNEWKGVVNAQYDYDAMGYITLEIKCKWDAELKDWVNLSKMTYEYDDMHNKISETTSSWNNQTKQWDEFYRGKFEYAYDGYGNPKQVAEYIWDVKKWKPVQTIYYYNHNQ